MSQEKLQTMSMQNFWGVKEVHYGIVQVVNFDSLLCSHCLSLTGLRLDIENIHFPKSNVELRKLGC